MKENIEIAKAIIGASIALITAQMLIAKRDNDKVFWEFLDGQLHNLNFAHKELSCESSANCSGTTPSHSGPPSSPPPQAPVTDSAPSESVSAVGSPEKLSWLPMSESVPPQGWYPWRFAGEEYMARVERSNGVSWDTSVTNNMEYLSIHLA